MTKQTFVFDVDNTLSVWNDDRDYDNFEPIHSMIEAVNALYDEGHKIILSTARGMSFYKGDREKIEKYNRPIIERWMKNNGVKYHELHMCKPLGDFYIDDKNLSILHFLASHSPSTRASLSKKINILKETEK